MKSTVKQIHFETIHLHDRKTIFFVVKVRLLILMSEIIMFIIASSIANSICSYPLESYSHITYSIATSIERID